MKERISADITIYGTDGQSIVTVPITAGSKRVVKLMESDYIQLSFCLAEAVHFPVGAYCDDEIFGKFYVTEEQMPRYNTSNGGYDYELKMDAWYRLWNMKQIMLIRNLPSDGSLSRSESVWYLTWSLKEQMRQFMRNLQLLGYMVDTYDFVTSDTDLNTFVKIDSNAVPKATEALTMSYSGQHMVDVLKSIADTWECEYWVTGTEEAFEIHFGKCECGSLETVSLEINAVNIEAQNDVSEQGDKLFYFGGLDNIPFTYRKTLMMKSLSKTYSGVDFKVKNEEMAAFGKLKAVVHYGTNDSQTITKQSVGGSSYQDAAVQWFNSHYSNVQYNRVVVIPDIEDETDIPLVEIKLYADFTYFDAYNTRDYIRVEEEITSNNEHWSLATTVHSVWVDASEALDVNQWRDYATQTSDGTHYIVEIGTNINEDAAGRYVVATFGGTYETKLYLDAAVSDITWTIGTAVRNDYLYYYGNEKILYDGALLIERGDCGTYTFFYTYANGSFVLHNEQSPFTTGFNAWIVEGELNPEAIDTEYLGCCARSVMNNNYESHLLTVPQQAIRVKVRITDEVYDELGDTITFTPNAVLSVCKYSDFPLQSSATSSSYTDATIRYEGLSPITLRKKDFFLDFGLYCAEYTISLPLRSMDVTSAQISAATQNNGYWVCFAVKTPFEGSDTVIDSEFVLPFSYTVKHTNLQAFFYVNVEQGTGDYAQFSWLTAPVNPAYFYLTESDVAPSASLALVPAVYWSDMYDDPASLLSIGDRRLQLPIYNAAEFAQYGAGMTYQNGYIVKDGMAYKNGYIIPSAMIGDDDNRSLRELSVTDDTVYPDGKLLIKEVPKKVDAKDKIDIEGQSESQTWSYKQYHLRLCLPDSQSSDFAFSRDYILPNSEPLKIRFLVPEDVKEYYESGAISQAQWEAIQTNCKLAGMQFNVAYNDSIEYKADDESQATAHTKDYWIERNDDFGAKLPSEILYPQQYDPCVLVNWNVLALSALGLIARAEYKLLNKAFEYYAALHDGNFTFTAEMMSDWMFDMVGGLQFVTSEGKNLVDADGKNFLVRNGHTVYAVPSLGQKIRVEHDALRQGYKDTRIIGMELKLDKPYDTPKLTIGETEAYSRLKKMEKEINKMSN